MPVPDPARILLIRPSALGDVARTVPLVVALRRAYPGAWIDWLVQDSFVDVAAGHPDVSRVLPFPRRTFNLWRETRDRRALWKYLRSFGREGYDLVIDAQGLARSAVIARFTTAPVRVGHADARECAWWFYTHRVPSDIETHTVERMAGLVRALGLPVATDAAAMRLYSPAHATGFAASVPGLSGRYAVLAPTSRWVSKQWPDERYAELAATLADRGIAVALVGATQERRQVGTCLELARKRPGVIDLVGGTGIGQLMDLIAHASLVVGNDSAALHIAVGFGRPLVALYGPTRVHRVGPWGRERDVIQHVTPADRLDHKDGASRVLMERIQIAEVLAACEERLKGL